MISKREQRLSEEVRGEAECKALIDNAMRELFLALVGAEAGRRRAAPADHRAPAQAYAMRRMEREAS